MQPDHRLWRIFTKTYKFRVTYTAVRTDGALTQEFGGSSTGSKSKLLASEAVSG